MSGTLELAKTVFCLKRIFRLLRKRAGIIPWPIEKDADIIAEIATLLQPHVMAEKNHENEKAKYGGWHLEGREVVHNKKETE